MVSFWGHPRSVLWASALEQGTNGTAYLSNISFLEPIFPNPFGHPEIKLVLSVPSSSLGKSLVSKGCHLLSATRDRCSTTTVTVSFLLKLSPLLSHQSGSLRNISYLLRRDGKHHDSQEVEHRQVLTTEQLLPRSCQLTNWEFPLSRKRSEHNCTVPGVDQ